MSQFDVAGNNTGAGMERAAPAYVPTLGRGAAFKASRGPG